MKVLLGLFLCLGLIGIASAQKNPCELTMKDVPTVRGLRLGMSRSELVKIIPGYKDSDLLILRKAALSNISGFENVEKVQLFLYRFGGIVMAVIIQLIRISSNEAMPEISRKIYRRISNCIETAGLIRLPTKHWLLFIPTYSQLI